METLYFITPNGVCGHTEVWDCEGAKCDADGWLDQYGVKVGRGSARLPSGGWIDLRQFATIAKKR